MNYDKIILELLSRVQVLEEEMEKIRSNIVSKKEISEDESLEVSEEGEYTRSQARNQAIKVIRSKYPDYIVEKAARKEGSGIKITRPDSESKRPIIIKFFHSKTHISKTIGDVDHAWHTVDLDDIMGTFIDICMFSVVDTKGNWNFLMYEPEELDIYNEANRSGKSGLLHLYFVVKEDKATEIRENTVDVRDHLNNWDILK